jgi:hypothetical protein
VSYDWDDFVRECNVWVEKHGKKKYLNPISRPNWMKEELK